MPLFAYLNDFLMQNLVLNIFYCEGVLYEKQYGTQDRLLYCEGMAKNCSAVPNKDHNSDYTTAI